MFDELRQLAQANIIGPDYCFRNDPERPANQPNVESEQDVQGRLGNTRWCICGECIPMPTIEESVCCWETENLYKYLGEDLICITFQEDMLHHCLNKDLLEFMIKFRGRTKPSDFRKHYHRVMHKAAYRAFTTWTHGFLGLGNRIPIPSCMVNLVRQTYPDPEGRYVGFYWAWDNPAIDMAMED
ncbi:hypothetical protein XELAEV_18003519mg [Xenopus laevis]|nr:hypothetical protein XELAEV_18003519mg [Xenopus laevis]